MKQKNLTLSLSMILFLALIILAGCGKGKKEVRNENIATPGRDKELYGQHQTQHAVRRRMLRSEIEGVVFNFSHV